MSDGSQSEGMNVSFCILLSVIWVYVCVRVVRQEAGPGDVLARLVGFDAVGFDYVACNCPEIVRMGCLSTVDFDYPFESVSGGTSEQQRGLEVAVCQKSCKESLNIGDVVKVNAEEARFGDAAGIASCGELPTEGGVVEVRGLVYSRP